VLRLLARPVHETDDREAWYSGLEVSLHLDAARLEADEGVGDRASEHELTVGAKVLPKINATAPTWQTRPRRDRLRSPEAG
jgi:hypothetical protein